ncbi:hypothetical protein Hamer_G008328 [Homarus americanus]|uniref:Uncharacterized protein n=1 Tax=Homarus americanus TaxID=6706 RepID=A0A8J5TLG3_HOMAM|nr:hypothetical protein Hamer_G008328 [Homarus americanus]
MTWVRWVKRGAERRGGTTVYTKHATATTSSSARKHASKASRAFMAPDDGSPFAGIVLKSPSGSEMDILATGNVLTEV